MKNLAHTTSYQCSLKENKSTGKFEKNLQVYNSVKRCASSNQANLSKIVMVTNISDQPSLSDVKPEPVFIGPENIAVPDSVDFCSYCSVSDSVGTDADELVP